MATTTPQLIISKRCLVTTTLTLPQLHTLFPRLHHYIHPSQPHIAVLPKTVSPVGLQKVLQFREAEVSERADNIIATVAECIQMDATMAFFGTSPLLNLRRFLALTLEEDIHEDLTLPDFQKIWQLHRLPFTEPYIKALVKALAKVDAYIDTETSVPEAFHWYIRENEDYAEKIRGKMAVLEWVCGDEELTRRVNGMKRKVESEKVDLEVLRLEKGAKAVKRMKEVMESKGKTGVEIVFMRAE
ncbi:hypothetical protein CC80DRAFT_487415 [Byssothecium circinans]|uniref:Uncharacterized protein n=1 Tax=Byssothecium circinans TaxID=147558 RepID=A0A6A5UE06_9PLEO|nr:hypothetical protein CC80DRAFT_487415 [Byssothecium circinans]